MAAQTRGWDEADLLEALGSVAQGQLVSLSLQPMGASSAHLVPLARAAVSTQQASLERLSFPHAWARSEEDVELLRRLPRLAHVDIRTYYFLLRLITSYREQRIMVREHLTAVATATATTAGAAADAARASASAAAAAAPPRAAAARGNGGGKMGKV